MTEKDRGGRRLSPLPDRRGVRHRLGQWPRFPAHGRPSRSNLSEGDPARRFYGAAIMALRPPGVASAKRPEA